MTRVLTLLLLLGLGAACSTVPPPPPSFALDYRAVGNHPAPTALPARVAVATFEAVPLYYRRSIVWHDGDTRGYYTTARWDSPPKQLMTEAVLEAARRHGGFTLVQRYPEAWGSPPELVIRGRIEAFEELATPDGRAAHVAVRTTLTDASGQATYWEGLVEAREPAPGADQGDLVDAFARAQARVADSVVSRARAVIAEGIAFGRRGEAGAAPE